MILTLILSAILMISLIGMIYAEVVFVQSKKLATTAPQDVQEALLDHPERFKGQHLIGWILLIVFVVAFVGAFIIGAADGVRRGYDFWQFFGRFCTMLYLEKAFDIMCLDWLLLCKSHFFQHYFPETENCAGYHQFGFNRKEQLTRIVVFPIISLLLAYLCMLLYYSGCLHI